MRPHDSRKMFAELVHSGQNDIVLDHGRVSGERYVVMPMGTSLWQVSTFFHGKWCC